MRRRIETKPNRTQRENKNIDCKPAHGFDTRHTSRRMLITPTEYKHTQWKPERQPVRRSVYREYRDISTRTQQSPAHRSSIFCGCHWRICMHYRTRNIHRMMKWWSEQVSKTNTWKWNMPLTSFEQSKATVVAQRRRNSECIGECCFLQCDLQ